MKFHSNQFIDTSRVSDWSQLLVTINARIDIHDWIFRGLETGPDKKNNVEISSHFDKAWSRRLVPNGSRQLYEAWMVREFRREAYHYLRDLPENGNLLEWLALARHYGMPVRLLDFTYSFYIAAYFAVSRRTKDQDGWILAFNYKWHINQLEKTIIPALRKKCKVPESEAALQDLRLFAGFAAGYPGDYVAAVNPFRRNPRLAAQQGLFLCPSNVRRTFEQNLEASLPKDVKNRKDHIILIKLPWMIRSKTMNELSRMNISSASLFRDLSGWAESRGDLVHREPPDNRLKAELKLELRKPR